MAIAGLLRPGDHAITTAASHNSVLQRPLDRARTAGTSLSVLPVAPDGSIDADAFEALFRPETRLVVATHASNVTGDVYDDHCAPGAHQPRTRRAVLPRCGPDRRGPAGAHGRHGARPGGLHRPQGPVRPLQGTGGLVVAEGVEVPPFKVGGSGVRSFDEEHPRRLPESLEAGTLTRARHRGARRRRGVRGARGRRCDRGADACARRAVRGRRARPRRRAGGGRPGRHRPLRHRRGGAGGGRCSRGERTPVRRFRHLHPGGSALRPGSWTPAPWERRARGGAVQLLAFHHGGRGRRGGAPAARSAWRARPREHAPRCKPSLRARLRQQGCPPGTLPREGTVHGALDVVHVLGFAKDSRATSRKEPSMKVIDAFGKQCPLPLVMAKKVIDDGCRDLAVQVDNETAVKNLSRLGDKTGLAVSVDAIEGGWLVSFVERAQGFASGAGAGAGVGSGAESAGERPEGASGSGAAAHVAEAAGVSVAAAPHGGVPPVACASGTGCGYAVFVSRDLRGRARERRAGTQPRGDRALHAVRVRRRARVAAVHERGRQAGGRRRGPDRRRRACPAGEGDRSAGCAAPAWTTTASRSGWEAGEVSNMYDILGRMQEAAKVVTL